MTVLSKACKSDNFESLTNSQGLCSKCEFFLESNSSKFPGLCGTNLDDSIISGNFKVRDYLPLILMNCVTHVHGLAVYMKEELSFAQEFSLEKSQDSYWTPIQRRVRKIAVASVCLLVCPSVCPSIQHFSQEWLISFF